MSDPPQVMPRPVSLDPRRWVVVGVSLLVVAFFLASPTPFPLGKLDAVAYAVCHRIPARSFFFGGQQLPLCARCSGTFLGILLTLLTLTLTGQSRAGRIPPSRVTIALAGFVLLWAIDGLNSFLTFYPGMPHLYEPRNWLRLTTGMLNGLALGTLTFSMFHFSLWRIPRPRPAIQGLGELAGLITLAGLLVGLVLTENPRLLYPLAVASVLGVLSMLTGVNTVVILVASRRENTAHRWRDAAFPSLAALALSLIIVMGIGAGRSALTETMGLPF